MATAKNKSILHYLLIIILYITLLAHISGGVISSPGPLILSVLLIGLFFYIALKKEKLLSQKPIISAVLSIPFLIFIILAKKVHSFIINFKEDILSSIGFIGFISLALILILFLTIKKSYTLFRHPVDIALIAAVVFIILFSPLTHMAGLTPAQQDYSVDYPLFITLAKVILVYMAINILLREGIFIKLLMILLILSLTLALLLP